MGETAALWLLYREVMAHCRNIYYLLLRDGHGVKHFRFAASFNPPNISPSGTSFFFIDEYAECMDVKVGL